MDPKGLVDATFERGKVAILALIVLAYLGFGTYMNAPREADPDIPLPFVQVLIPLPGISPQDAERLLIRPAENELQSVEGLIQIDATAYESVAVFRLEFEVGLDMDQVVDDVSTAVDRAKPDFPVDTQEPLVEEFNAQSLIPAVTVILSGDVPERTMFRLAQTMEDELSTLPGVLEVDLSGFRDELIEITVSPEALDNYGLSPMEIANALRSNNTLVTAGNLRFTDGSYGIKVPGLIKSISDIEGIPVRANDESIITIGDIATVKRTFEEAEGYARFNGRVAMGLDISKRSDANMIDVTKEVKATALSLASDWPSTIQVSFIGDQSVLVDSIFTSLTSSIALAIILVMIIVVAALGARSALLVGIAIPSSFLIGLSFIGFFGFTMNNLVMFSMVLSVGMLVDGAIVIVELADRFMAEGTSRREAFRQASKRMFWPIVTSTATTLTAFVPFLFWQSIEGYFLRWIPITLILVLSASLLVALFFLPLIGSMMRRPRWWRERREKKLEGVDQSHKADLDHIDPTLLPGFTGRYAKTIAWLIKRPIGVSAGSMIVLFICVATFSASDTAVEQFIRIDDERVQVFIEGRGNLSQSEILEVASTVQNVVIQHPAVENSYLQSGGDVSRNNDAPIDAIALINLDLLPYAERDHSLVVIEELRKVTESFPGIKVEIRQPEAGPPIGKDVQVEITAPSFDTAIAAAKRVRSFLEQDTQTINGQTIPTFMDVEDTLPLPGIEWAMQPDRAEAGRYGISIAEIGAAVQLITEGMIVDTFRPDDANEELDIRVRYPEADRRLETLNTIKLATPRGNVPLSNFTTRVAEPQVDRILRRDGKRVLDVMANANIAVPGIEISQDQATQRMTEWLASGVLEEEFGADVGWRLRGASEKTSESSAWMAGAMMFAMLTIGVILLLQFDSFYHAALTLSSVVLSVVGVLFGIAVSGQYISVIMTGVGIVALVGIVVNNNIVLIDTFKTLRNQGLDTDEAAVRTASQRLRPVLLTTITTIIGLLPMVFEINIDFGTATIGIGNATSAWWVLLSSTIVYGLAFATLLTLILTPVLLAAPHIMSTRIKSVSQKALKWPLQRPSRPAADSAK